MGLAYNGKPKGRKSLQARRNGIWGKKKGFELDKSKWTEEDHELGGNIPGIDPDLWDNDAAFKGVEESQTDEDLKNLKEDLGLTDNDLI